MRAAVRVGFSVAGGAMIVLALVGLCLHGVGIHDPHVRYVRSRPCRPPVDGRVLDRDRLYGLAPALPAHLR